MTRIISMLTVVALLVAISAVPAFAASPSQEECEAAGGTFDRQQGTVSCVIVEEGKPHPKDKFEDVQTEESQGTLQNQPHHEESSECTDTGSGKCPPGQF